MTQPSFTFPENTANLIRVYDEDEITVYSNSDLVSELSEAESDENVFDIRTLTIQQRLEENIQYFDDFKQSTSPWNEQVKDGSTFIRKPTASEMYYKVLHPVLYRNINGIDSLNTLSIMVGAPPDWETRYNDAISRSNNSILSKLLATFSTLPANSSEAIIESAFIGLVSVLADHLGVEVSPESQRKCYVGGILARDNYNVLAKKDANFNRQTTEGMHCCLATEINTPTSFPETSNWYHKSRAVQVLCAMYSFNAPIMLLTQQQWKLFVENSERNAIFTFPFGTEPGENFQTFNSLETMRTGTTFLKAIAICLMSSWSTFQASKNSIDEAMLKSIDEGTPIKRQLKQSEVKTVEHPSLKRQKDRLGASRKKNRKTPMFLNENNEYVMIRIFDEDEKEDLELEFKLLEKEE
jgi:hypothetical protein